MARNEITSVVKLMLSPKLIGTTAELIGAHQKKALADGDADLVTEFGNARKMIAKLTAPKHAEAPPAETATDPGTSTEAPGDSTRRRSRT
jgi:hypothetical protein